MLLPGLLVCCLLLSGCQAPGDVTLDAPTATPTPTIAETGSGSIAGIVVDASQLPLANVTVALQDSGKSGAVLANASSAEDGSFRFNSLQPGIYRLVATLTGFGEGATLVTVVSDETVEARLVLQDVPSELPYLEVQQRTGLFRCAFAVILMPTRCDEVLEAAGLGEPSGYFGNFTINKGHQAIVLETNWDAPDTTLDVWTSYIDAQGDWKYFQEVRGTPILRLDLVPEQDFRGAYTSVQDSDFYGAVPPSSEGFQMNTETTYIGQFQEEADTYLNPACTYTWGNCTGAGAVFDFRFDQFVSTFYNEAPADVASYSALPKDN